MIKRVDHKYRKWTSKQPCAKCGRYMTNCIAPAHQRILGGGGTGMKPHDKDILPLCPKCHTDEHDGAVTFWEQGDKPKTKEYVQALCNKHIRRYENEI